MPVDKKTESVRTSLLLRKDTVQKLKVIAIWERKTQTDLLDIVLLEYVEAWKKKNPNVIFPETENK